MSIDEGTSSGHGRFGFHALKKLVKGGDTTAVQDPDFDHARKTFDRLSQQTTRTRASLQLYIQSLRTVLNSASTLGAELSDNIDDKTDGSNSASAYDALSTELRKSHIQLGSTDGVVNLTNNFTDSTLKRLDDQISNHKRLSDQIQQRDKLKEELEYYTKKVAELNAENAKTQQKGKAVAPKDQERQQRNNSKLVEVKQQFTTLNTQLLDEIRQLYDSKIDIFGPVASEFVELEKNFINVYSNAIQNIPKIGSQPRTVNTSRSQASAPTIDKLHISDPFDNSSSAKPPSYNSAAATAPPPVPKYQNNPTSNTPGQNPFGDLQ